MKFAVNSKVLHKCQAILGIRLFMKNVAAQVALQTVQKDKRGQSGRGWGGRIPLPRNDKTDDKTRYEQVLQGLHHIMRALVIQLKTTWH